MGDPSGRIHAARAALDVARREAMERQAQDAQRLHDLQTELAEALNAAKG